MAAWLIKADCLDSFFFELLLLMVQKSCDHQLRLVVSAIIYKGFIQSQVVILPLVSRSDTNPR